MTALALYIHWPFCKKKCPYCDFNSHMRAHTDDAAFGHALVRELACWQETLGPRRVTSIFFGGGTPSLMPPALVEELIAAAGTGWALDAQCEITLEANPTSSEAQKFQDVRAAGVNRLSVGVQALNDDVLRFLGREHSATEARAVVEMAQRIFPRVSFDLIYAYKDHTPAQWAQTLADALRFGTEHLSLYQLTLEPNTVFADMAARGAALTADEDTSAALFTLTQDMTAAAGLPAYEISNHARPGGKSRHNLAYWLYQEYVGIGPGAHGRVYIAPGPLRASARTAAYAAEPSPEIPGAHGRVILKNLHSTITLKNPERWRAEVEKSGHAAAHTQLSAADQKEEAFLMGLRLAKGINRADWRARFGTPLTEILNREKLHIAEREGLAVLDEHALRVTDAGKLLLTRLTGELLRV